MLWWQLEKAGWEKVGGDMLLLLVTIGEPSIAGYLRVWQRRYRADHPGTSHCDKISDEDNEDIWRYRRSSTNGEDSNPIDIALLRW